MCFTALIFGAEREQNRPESAKIDSFSADVA
jgi:hypothetical protein